MKKHRFTSFLELAASPLAFSADQLSGVPNLADEDEDDPEKLDQLKAAISNDSDDGEHDDHDERLHSLLKSLLSDDQEQLSQDNAGPFEPHDDVNDAPHEGEVADENYEDEKHNQLLAAIEDLRNEIKASREQPAEENEEHWLHGKAPTKGTANYDIWKQKVAMDKRPRIKVTRVETEENEETHYEEDEQEDTKQAAARQLFTSLVNQGKHRQDIIDQFMKQIGVTQSTATSYYQRLAKEAGLTTSGNRVMPGETEPSGLGVAAGAEPQGGGLPQGGQQQQPGMEIPMQPESNIDGFEVEGDPNKQGLIRTVKGAHLVYKRKNEEGTYDELWNFGTAGDMKSVLGIRRAILAGTDIPPRAMKSENGSQTYTLTSLGNGQLLHIKGLPN